MIIVGANADVVATGVLDAAAGVQAGGGGAGGAFVYLAVVARVASGAVTLVSDIHTNILKKIHVLIQNLYNKLYRMI